MPTHEIPKAFRPLYKQQWRYFVYYGGRGGAKSWAFAQALLLKGWEQKTRVLCTREYQGSIKDSVHKLLKDRILAMGLDGFYTVTNDSIVGANGTEFFFAGIRHDPQKIKSAEGIDICWVEEAATVSEASWRFLIPTIRKTGSQIWVSFNPGLKTDPTYQRFIVNPPKNALIVKVSWRDNPWFSDELREEMEHDKERDYDEYLHVWEGELKMFADGAIYGKQLREAREEGRITDVPIAKQEVNLFADLGRNDHTAFWFHQQVGLQHRFIDYLENRLVDLEWYAKAIKDKGYLIGTLYLPHDADHEILGMQKTRTEMFRDLGFRDIIVVPRVRHINEGIEQTRNQFGSAWFDAKRCEKGLDALASYQYVYDETHATHRQMPLHNWASNGADAFRQWAQGYQSTDDWGEPMQVDTSWIL